MIHISGCFFGACNHCTFVMMARSGFGLIILFVILNCMTYDAGHEMESFAIQLKNVDHSSAEASIGIDRKPTKYSMIRKVTRCVPSGKVSTSYVKQRPTTGYTKTKWTTVTRYKAKPLKLTRQALHNLTTRKTKTSKAKGHKVTGRYTKTAKTTRPSKVGKTKASRRKVTKYTKVTKATSRKFTGHTITKSAKTSKVRGHKVTGYKRNVKSNAKHVSREPTTTFPRQMSTRQITRNLSKKYAKKSKGKRGMPKKLTTPSKTSDPFKAKATKQPKFIKGTRRIRRPTFLNLPKKYAKSTKSKHGMPKKFTIPSKSSDTFKAKATKQSEYSKFTKGTRHIRRPTFRNLPKKYAKPTKSKQILPKKERISKKASTKKTKGSIKNKASTMAPGGKTSNRHQASTNRVIIF